MKKTIQLTESDLVRLVNKVTKKNRILEQKSGKSYNIYLAGPNVLKKMPFKI